MLDLKLYPLGGLSNPYSGVHASSSEPVSLKACGVESLKGANSVFWKLHFADNMLESLIVDLKAKYRYTECNVPEYSKVLENPDRFLDQAVKAPGRLVDMTTSEREFFLAAETVTILCDLYSDFVYRPFHLTFDQGFLLDEVDTRHLIENCLNSKTNPYYNFIVEHCLSVIESLKPQLLWLISPIRFSNLAMAMLARERCADIHICVVDTLSEFYSLNKIRQYLRLNVLLFSVIDSIILEDVENTQQQLNSCLDMEDSLDKVPNLMYIDRRRKKIEETPFKISKKKSLYITKINNSNSAEKGSAKKSDGQPKFVEMKMWPEAKCYWDRCTFCSINHKYHTLPNENKYEGIDGKVQLVSRLAEKGYGYLWLVDEAIPPKVLKEFASKLMRKNVKIYWQARSRIDKGFTQKICETMAKSGLREIRLGLESANHRILKRMNKFTEDFSLSLVDDIVNRFHRSGVSVHLCAIIGFPTETPGECKETLDFLYELKKKYSSLTFNLNNFMLDVTSKIYANYETYDITSLKWPCPPRYFLGNIIGWGSEKKWHDSQTFDSQVNNFMRQVLYPWMPSSDTVKSGAYYEICENYRKTLLWKSNIALNVKKINK